MFARSSLTPQYPLGGSVPPCRLGHVRPCCSWAFCSVDECGSQVASSTGHPSASSTATTAGSSSSTEAIVRVRGQPAQRLALDPAGGAVVVVRAHVQGFGGQARARPATCRRQRTVALGTAGQVHDVVLRPGPRASGRRPRRATGRGPRPGRTRSTAAGGPAGGAGGAGRRPAPRRCRRPPAGPSRPAVVGATRSQDRACCSVPLRRRPRSRAPVTRAGSG